MDYKKLTSITEALYRVTDLMPDQEPLKWMLRNQALSVFEMCWNSKSDKHFKSRLTQSEQTSVSLKKLVSLLELASSTSFISKINFEVISREYLSFIEEIIKIKSSNMEVKSLLAFREDGREEKTYEDSTGQFNIGESERKNLDKSIANSVKKIIEFGKSDALGKSTETTEPVNNNLDKRMEIERKDIYSRQEKIINYLSNNGISGRSDIHTIFNNSVSEKTLQRDLVLLVEKGILTKEGNKRWCKYGLRDNHIKDIKQKTD